MSDKIDMNRCFIFDRYVPEDKIASKFYLESKGEAHPFDLNEQESRELVIQLIDNIVEYHENAIGINKNPYILDQFKVMKNLHRLTKDSFNKVKKLVDEQW
jgi:hypothetical protein